VSKPLLDPQSKALLQLGYMRWIDAGLAAVILMTLFTTLAWAIFGTFTLNGLAVSMLSIALEFLLWIVMLVYRCIWFLLVYVVAEIKTMPAKAARLALAFSSGSTPHLDE